MNATTGSSAESQAHSDALTEGFLHHVLFCCFTTPARPFDELLPHLEDHLAYLQRLEREGKLFAAGPFLDDHDRFAGPGMLIYRADSREAAAELAAGDPFHARGLRTFEIRPWQMNEGTILVRLAYSTGRFELT